MISVSRSWKQYAKTEAERKACKTERHTRGPRELNDEIVDTTTCIGRHALHIPKSTQCIKRVSAWLKPIFGAIGKQLLCFLVTSYCAACFF